MKNNPVGWFEIYVDDINRARRFYESVFNIKLENLQIQDSDMELWAFPMIIDRMGASGALVKMEGFPAGRNSTLVYFSCEDCAVEEVRVVESGGKVQRIKTSIGEYGFISLVFDTEGNMFGLHSRK